MTPGQRAKEEERSAALLVEASGHCFLFLCDWLSWRFFSATGPGIPTPSQAGSWLCFRRSGRQTEL